MEDFTAADITGMKVLFSLGTDFDNLLRDAEFEKTSTRATQAKARADEAAALAAKLAALGEQGDGTGDDGDGGSGNTTEP